MDTMKEQGDKITEKFEAAWDAFDKNESDALRDIALKFFMAGADVGAEVAIDNYAEIVNKEIDRVLEDAKGRQANE